MGASEVVIYLMYFHLCFLRMTHLLAARHPPLQLVQKLILLLQLSQL